MLGKKTASKSKKKTPPASSPPEGPYFTPQMPLRGISRSPKETVVTGGGDADYQFKACLCDRRLGLQV